MSDDDERLDRLNYYNGQRLEAADFRTEQDYHMFVRRELNRSLYSDGIAAGLEVRAKSGDKHKVVVSPGLALDQEGREIILLEATDVQVMGNPSAVEGEVFGNYLCIKYEEEKTGLLDSSCSMATGSGKGVTRTWSGPSRIRAGATLSIQATWPKAKDRLVVLAQLELDGTCAIRNIHTFVRKYAIASAKAAVHPFALEGEADIGELGNGGNVSKKVYFHIRGGAPDTVTLYLKGELFSRFFYTELGRHSHDIKFKTEKDGEHTHKTDLGSFKIADNGGSHDHKVEANLEGENTLETEGNSGTFVDMAQVGIKVSGGAHGHDITGVSIDILETDSEHKHQIDGTSDETGASLNARASGAPLTYVSELMVSIDGNDITSDILSRFDPAHWGTLGDGTGGHPFVTDGTGELDLSLLGIELKEGQHILELSVASGGGRVRYNLYVD
jgi:hypothetical protein